MNDHPPSETFGAGSSPPEPNPEPPVPSVDWFRARVRGRVQGVGFRFWTVGAARKLGVAGWVRNTPEGDVEVEAEGGREALEAFASRLEKGPILARVRDLDLHWGQRPPRFSEFSVEYGIARRESD